MERDDATDELINALNERLLAEHENTLKECKQQIDIMGKNISNYVTEISRLNQRCSDFSRENRKFKKALNWYWENGIKNNISIPVWVFRISMET